MTRQEVHLTLYRPPWFVRLARWIRNPCGGWPHMQGRPWWADWFAVLVPYRLRSAHRWYARRVGRFWLPCPLCGAGFGGHEFRPVAGRPCQVPDPTHQPAGPHGMGMGLGICPRCTKAGRGVPL